MRATLPLLVVSLCVSGCGQSGAPLSPSPVGASARPPESSRLPAPPVVTSTLLQSPATTARVAPTVVLASGTRSLPAGGAAAAGAALTAPAAPYLDAPVVFGTTVRINWSWEAYFGGDPPTWYILAYTLPSGASGSLEVTTKEVTAGDLAVGAYSIRVSANNKAGQSPWSATQSFSIVDVFDPGATQARLDMLGRRATDSRFGTGYTDVLGLDRNYFIDYDIRWMDFDFSRGRTVRMYHATAKVNAAVRFTMFFDPDTNAWTDWVAVGP